MSVNIIQSLIPEGYQNRPSTNPKSSRYKIIIPPKWITVHNAWSPGDAHALNAYQKTTGCVTRPASWHLSVSNNLVVQGVPFGETAWNCGDYVNIANPGIGNTQSIGMEICDFYDYKTETNNQQLYLLAEEYSTIVVAHLIKTVPSLLKFPACVVPHTKWRPASGCPSRILGRRNGWDDYISRIEEKLKESDPQPKPIQDEVWYRVIAGSYRDRTNADMVRQNLIKQGFKGVWINVHRG